VFEDKPKKQTADPNPPRAEEVLIKIFKSSRNRSAHIPHDNLAAANWWMAHQEERQTADLPHPAKDRDGNITGWITPYHDRLSYNLRKFLKMSEAEKAFIVHHVERGIPWRGDDIEFYKMVVAESAKMETDPQYIDKGIERMKKLARRMVV